MSNTNTPGASESNVPTEFADVQFAELSHPNRGDRLIVAIGDFEGVPKVGCGQTRQEAIVDLLHNALPGKEMKFSPVAAMELAHLDRLKPNKKES